ncbi:MAG: diaminopropionate ammonia-lyase [Oscillospiraceae bacterium]|nr:diaminopropionate ammonia-lyase [Oscillospiraceae bacterium]
MNIIQNTWKTAGQGVNVDWLSPKVAQRVMAFHCQVPGYGPTPLKSLPELAEKCGVKALLVKDESPRFGLNAFKGLGGIYAVAQAAGKLLGLEPEQITFPELKKPEYQVALHQMIFATATDGNHGKGVAWAAGLLGCPAKVFMPKGSSPRRAQAIRDAGQAEVTITQWNYDDTVNYVNQCAEKNGWVLVQDTSWGGYEQVPKWIMQGYTTMAQEAAEQLTEMPTHIFLQAGVGAMAGAVTGYYRARYGENCPKIVLVEPYGAACIYESMEAGDGQPHTAKGNGETIMAGLNCGSPCTVAWDILRDYGSYALECGDNAAKLGMRTLRRFGIVSGESGASGIGAFLELARSPEQKAKLGIGPDAKILFFSTEGNTDPESYEAIMAGADCAEA